MDKQIKEFNFHGIKLNGIYNPNLDSWWFKGKDVYRCLNVSRRMICYYLKSINNKDKVKLNSGDIDLMFGTKHDKYNNQNHLEWILSESAIWYIISRYRKPNREIDKTEWVQRNAFDSLCSKEAGFC